MGYGEDERGIGVDPITSCRARVVEGGENSRNFRGIPRVYYHQDIMKIAVFIPDSLIHFADAEAKRRGTTRSGFLTQLLEAEKMRVQTKRHIDEHGWDVADDEGGWQAHQRRRMAEEYADDEW
jgi:hypothetical protein